MSRPQHFPILNLPAELTVRIIQQAIIISSREDPIHLEESSKSHAQPAITRVCRLFRAEGLPVFYKHNFFTAESSHYGTENLVHWLQSIGQVNASKIEHLYIYWWGSNKNFNLSWQKFLFELRFLDQVTQQHWYQSHRVGRSKLGSIHVRCRDDKVLFGSGQFQNCYRLMVMKHPLEDDERRDPPSLVEDLEDQYSEREPNELDYWVLE